MANLTVRMDEKLKRKAKRIFEKQGLDMSTAVKMFFSQVVAEKGVTIIPLHKQEILKKRWDAEFEDTIKNGKSYSSAEEMFADMDM
jgi:addiction module RelB/DinJ family antitoxin